MNNAPDWFFHFLVYTAVTIFAAFLMTAIWNLIFIFWRAFKGQPNE